MHRKRGELGLLLVIVLGEEKGFYDTPECIMYMGANSILRWGLKWKHGIGATNVSLGSKISILKQKI